MSAVDEHLDKVSQPQRAALQRIREIVKQAVPEAEEVITYGMPGFKYKKKYLFAYAAFKDHMSIFPAAAPIEAMKNKLSDFEISKGTVQFTLENPIPERLIRQLVSVRLKEITK